MTHVSRTINEKKNRLILHEIWENTDFFDTVMKLDYQTIMDNAWCLSPEKIFERCLPALSGGAYEFIDADHYDYTDFSDAKTFCTGEEPSSGFSSFPFEISGLKGKVGAIRAICANSQYDCVHFFFIPADKVKKLRTEHKCNDQYRILGNFNDGTNDESGPIKYRGNWGYNRLDEFRVDTIFDLAKAN